MLLLSGCVYYAVLTPDGQLVRQIYPSGSGDCKYLGVVQVSDHEWEFLGAPDLINQLRNEVASIGGDSYASPLFTEGDYTKHLQAEAYYCGHARQAWSASRGSLAPSNASMAPISEDEARALIQAMTDAFVTLDYDAWANYISDDAWIELIFDIDGQSQVQRFSKAEYLQLAKDGLEQYSFYSYTPTGLSIRVAEDGSYATAVEQATEQVVIEGREVTVYSISNSLIQYVGSELKVVEIRGRATF
jgi:hypothetical protein